MKTNIFFSHGLKQRFYSYISLIEYHILFYLEDDSFNNKNRLKMFNYCLVFLCLL